MHIIALFCSPSRIEAVPFLLEAQKYLQHCSSEVVYKEVISLLSHISGVLMLECLFSTILLKVQTKIMCYSKNFIIALKTQKIRGPTRYNGVKTKSLHI